MRASRLRPREAGGRRAKLTGAMSAAAALCVALLLSWAGPPPAEAAPAPWTVVSLTFDDGRDNQMNAAPVLAANGVPATFFVSSGLIDAPGYFTRAELDELARAGHEIGGHTVDHPNLAALPLDEAKRQLCWDRNTLLTWGYDVRSLAYPFASTTPEVEAAAEECGYSSARSLGELRTRFGCEQCAEAESIPPRNAFYTEAPAQVDSSWTLEDLQDSVTSAESVGGWVQLTFHDLCETGCSELNVTPKLLDDFLRWLTPRAETNGTVVQTVGDTMGGDVRPRGDAPEAAPAPPGVNAVKNAGFEGVDADGVPACWMEGNWGENATDFGTSRAANSGEYAGIVATVRHASGDAKLLPQLDLGTCAPTVLPGTSYSLRAWYSSTAKTQFVTYLRTAEGSWEYWTASPYLHAASGYERAIWMTPPIPPGYTGMSFGLSLFEDGVLRVDDIGMYAAGGTPGAQRMPPGTAPGGIRPGAAVAV
ncbi:polysaccharide deacetylase family protein [Pseudoclavibacter sp. VKM Ac-2888]|uniref:polysaccharide deacetylase family protein n=1 Tax=Pseudoclavibacter sp. VKM Ac-2888 TaxID=2783830 RepID=UPI00188CC7FB|nr:polysaccharide deacetylase family protein [Pseudoclavibacter sp. VKM Ac-2888]MBF4550440.1 polysaccharide deacetylase family protein [Pseudoclavibacter sp. VKM Ac-2888]